jgi:hypothetical protein
MQVSRAWFVFFTTSVICLWLGFFMLAYSVRLQNTSIDLHGEVLRLMILEDMPPFAPEIDRGRELHL